MFYICCFCPIRLNFVRFVLYSNENNIYMIWKWKRIQIDGQTDRRTPIQTDNKQYWLNAGNLWNFFRDLMLSSVTSSYAAATAAVCSHCHCHTVIATAAASENGQIMFITLIKLYCFVFLFGQFSNQEMNKRITWERSSNPPPPLKTFASIERSVNGCNNG